ncbi:hypothetical protein GQR88_12485 [Burkholderia glumae AU6208]|nr:hypothetical protein GQR88_12485 [Burkholderia glumae AU6208]
MQLLASDRAQPGCADFETFVQKFGCNAGKPCRIRNIGHPEIGVTMRAF